MPARSHQKKTFRAETYLIHQQIKNIEEEIEHGYSNSILVTDDSIAIDVAVFPRYSTYLQTVRELSTGHDQYINDQYSFENGYLVLEKLHPDDEMATEYFEQTKEAFLFSLALDLYMERNGHNQAGQAEAVPSCAKVCFWEFKACRALAWSVSIICPSVCNLSVACVEECKVRYNADLLECELEYITCYFYACHTCPD